MKQINLLTFTILASRLHLSCTTETKKEVERITINTEIITDSIYTRMPGNLFKLENYLLWQDPFGSAMDLCI